jgi:hypothetical protein
MTFAVPHKELRYIFPIALPLILLSAGGISYFTAHENKVIKYMSLIALVLLGVFSFMPVFERTSQPFINTFQTEEMKASEFIKQNYTPSTTIYTNNNYPVFAYYTQMKVVVLEERDQMFYSVFPDNMKEEGIIIVYKGFNHPTLEWIDSNAHFKLAKEFENLIVYHYNPGIQNY